MLKTFLLLIKCIIVFFLFQTTLNATENFTDTEARYIKTKKVLNIGIHKNWMPISKIEESGEPKGVVNDYINLIAAESGFKVNIQNNSFKKSVQLMQNRQVDILVGDLNDLDLKKKYMPIYTHNIPVVLLMYGPHKHIYNILELRGKRIAIEKTALYKQNFYSDYPALTFVEVDRLEDAISGVYDGTYDVLVSTTLQIDYTLLDLGLSNFSIVGTTNEFLKLSIFLHKDNRILIDIVSKILKQISTEKKHQINQKWSATNFVDKIDYTIAYIVAFFSLVIVLSLIYYSKKIKIESKKRKEAEVEAQKANAMKSMFLANMSHEIRTPMNSVIGFSDLLQNTDLDAKQEKYVASIKAGGKSLLTLINDILDISKIEAGKFQLEEMEVDVLNILSDMESIFAPKCEQKGIRFLLDVAQNTPKVIQSDDVRIRQILINLLSNAIKFTQDGCVTLRVAFSETKELHFSVEDTGIGIVKEEQIHIFEAFSQQLGQSNKEYGGTGLGLSISSKLAALLHAKLYCESDGIHGSAFIFSMQNVTVLDSVEVLRVEEGGSVSFKGQSVLIVDDNMQNLELLSEMLLSLNLKVMQAKDGKEAYNIAKEQNFDIVLTDIRMPVMGGEELLEKLQKLPYYKSIPILAVTASVMKEEQKRLLKNGFALVIEKPLEIERVKDALNNYLISLRLKEVVKREQKPQISFNLKSVSQEIFMRFQRAQKSGMMDDMEEFAHYITESSDDVELKNFALLLQKSIENFDIESIENLKSKFQSLEVMT